jgi:chromate transporter
MSGTHICFNGVAKVNVFSICAKFFAKTFRLQGFLLILNAFEALGRAYRQMNTEETSIKNTIAQAGDNPARVSLWTLATVFAKIGMFTLGGGYAMIPLIDREVVEKRRWLEKDEFYDILSIAQSSPGLLIVNISIFAGYRLRGRRGSVAATIGSCLPSFLIILAIALFFAGYRDNVYVEKIFKGIRPVVVALIAVPVVDMVIRSKLNIWRALLAIGTAAAILFLKVSPIYILLVFFACFFCARYFGQKKSPGKSQNKEGGE